MATQDRHDPQRHDSSSSPQDQIGRHDDRRPRKKRQRNFTAEDRAAHRVFEKCRREAFKERLVTLSNLIPAITGTDPSRLSKHVVLDESVTHIQQQQTQIQSLLEERDALIAEINQWRSSAGIPHRNPTNSTTTAHDRAPMPPEETPQTQSEASSVEPDGPIPTWALLGDIDLDLGLCLDPSHLPPPPPPPPPSAPNRGQGFIPNSGPPQEGDAAAPWLNPSAPPFIIPPEHHVPRMASAGQCFPP